MRGCAAACLSNFVAAQPPPLEKAACCLPCLNSALPDHFSNFFFHFSATLVSQSSVVPFSDSYKEKVGEILGYVPALSEDSLKDVFKLKSNDITDLPFRLVRPGWNATDVEGSYVIASYCWPAPDPEVEGTTQELSVLNPSLGECPCPDQTAKKSPGLFHRIPMSSLLY